MVRPIIRSKWEDNNVNREKKEIAGDKKTNWEEENVAEFGRSPAIDRDYIIIIMGDVQ